MKWNISKWKKCKMYTGKKKKVVTFLAFISSLRCKTKTMENNNRKKKTKKPYNKS